MYEGWDGDWQSGLNNRQYMLFVFFGMYKYT